MKEMEEKEIEKRKGAAERPHSQIRLYGLGHAVFR